MKNETIENLSQDFFYEGRSELDPTERCPSRLKRGVRCLRDEVTGKVGQCYAFNCTNCYRDFMDKADRDAGSDRSICLDCAARASGARGGGQLDTPRAWPSIG